MNIMIINCHTANRGDEAAVHALVDELNDLYKENLNIILTLRGETFYPNMPKNVKMMKQFMPGNIKALLAYKIAFYTHGYIRISRTCKEFLDALKKSDLVLHAPGGPSIGDTYYESEPSYLLIYDLIQMMNKPYMFYAPSMGPFFIKERNEWRKKTLKNAEAIVLRDPISAEYVKTLVPEKRIYQTLDSAIQHDIDVKVNGMKLEQYGALKNFLKGHKKCIGITISDLKWHPIFGEKNWMFEMIQNCFDEFLDYLTEKNYGIIFIPQLYGEGDDFNLMKSFCKNSKDYFVIPDNKSQYDTYFQQYLIGELFTVIGMRYHSNIFSAKMGTPFISISYEQKMEGFMEKMKLDEYCVKVENLSFEVLKEKFNLLCDNYDSYKKYLINNHAMMKKESYKTTEILSEVIEKIL